MFDCRQDGAKLDGPRGSYIFNPGVRGIDEADAILLIGTNPRVESPVLNARIRKRYLHGRCAIASIGPAANLTYPVERLGAGPATLSELVAAAAKTQLAGRLSGKTRVDQESVTSRIGKWNRSPCSLPPTCPARTKSPLLLRFK